MLTGNELYCTVQLVILGVNHRQPVSYIHEKNMNDQRNDRSVQTAVRLAAWTVERLKRNPEGLSDEVRRILLRAFEVEDRYDAQTIAFGADVMELARLLHEQAKGQANTAWWQHPEMLEALKVAINEYLDWFFAEEVDEWPTKNEAVAAPIKTFKKLGAANIGRSHARQFLNQRELVRKKKEELEKLETQVARLRRELEG
jgi:hypothetical protein